MHDQTYDPRRAQRLADLLRGLAARISSLSTDQALLQAGPELIKLMGDARSELFHYEVRATYDTPEVAEARRIVEEARRSWEPAAEDGDVEEEEPWRDR